MVVAAVGLAVAGLAGSLLLGSGAAATAVYCASLALPLPHRGFIGSSAARAEMRPRPWRRRSCLKAVESEEDEVEEEISETAAPRALNSDAYLDEEEPEVGLAQYIPMAKMPPMGSFPIKVVELEPGGPSYCEAGYKQLCEHWNKEEAEMVQKAKRTLMSPNTTKEAKHRAIGELEYWAVRRGGYDAEIILVGAMKSEDKLISAEAHMALKKSWESHFNAWVNRDMIDCKMFMKEGRVHDALEILNKIIDENPLWGEGYHVRAKIWNMIKDVDRTLEDLRKALEHCPNNYVTMVELGLALMEHNQAYEETHDLLEAATDLCPHLPSELLFKVLYKKAPELKAHGQRRKEDKEFSDEAPPWRLMPETWVERQEAIDRPSQAFLRVGAELEQWFTAVQLKGLPRGRQRKLWSMLVIAWDPDKHPEEVRTFTTEVHEAIKARRERELAKEGEVFDMGGTDNLRDYEDLESAKNYLKRMRKKRREARKRAVSFAEDMENQWADSRQAWLEEQMKDPVEEAIRQAKEREAAEQLGDEVPR